jgi:two-component system, response regulator PdtaR
MFSARLGGAYSIGASFIVKFRVLIVEDDPFIAMDLEGVLSEAGCDICGVAASESEALRMGEETRPSFAVVDVRLSPGDGRVVARQLHREYDTAVLIATANSRDVDNLAATGALGCLPKPYSADDVPAALRAIWDLRQGRAVTRLPNQMFALNRPA